MLLTYSRASMSDSRLSNLALIAVERELSEKLMHAWPGWSYWRFRDVGLWPFREAATGITAV